MTNFSRLPQESGTLLFINLEKIFEYNLGLAKLEWGCLHEKSAAVS
jgi:hypothetical protein